MFVFSGHCLLSLCGKDWGLEQLNNDWILFFIFIFFYVLVSYSFNSKFAHHTSMWWEILFPSRVDPYHFLSPPPGLHHHITVITSSRCCPITIIHIHTQWNWSLLYYGEWWLQEAGVVCKWEGLLIILNEGVRRIK